MTTSRHSRSARAFVFLLLSASLLMPASLAPSRAVAAEAWTWPVDGEVLTTYVNGDDPYAAGQHRGIDVGAPVGSTVRAATAGTVTFAGTAGSSGLTVSVRTADDRFDTSYLHLEAIDVSEGEVVEPGSELGAVGVSGRRSAEAPHVHFGVRDAGERHAYRDPLLFLGAPRRPAPQPTPPPVAAPVRPAPKPAPAPVAAPSPRPRPAPSLRPSPVPSPAPSPKGAPAAVPAPGPEAAPRPLPGGAPRRAVRPAPRAGEAPRPAAQPVPSEEPAPQPAPGPGGRRAPHPAGGPVSPGLAREADRRQPAGVPGAGFDLGWALACAGLGMAVAMLLVPRRLRRRPARAAAPRHPTAAARAATGVRALAERS